MVKTTPKPRATKKSRDELLELPGPPLAWVAVAVGPPVGAVLLAGSVTDADGAVVELLMMDIGW